MLYNMVLALRRVVVEIHVIVNWVKCGPAHNALLLVFRAVHSKARSSGNTDDTYSDICGSRVGTNPGRHHP
jgi:hypothetical protein